jgi:hypothetical protein
LTSKDSTKQKIFNTSIAFDKLNGKVDISWPWESIKEDIKLQPKGVLGNYESQQH